MERAEVVAHEALQMMVETSANIGLTEAWHELVRDVYVGNLDRYEPVERGDSRRPLARSAGATSGREPCGASVTMMTNPPNGTGISTAFGSSRRTMRSPSSWAQRGCSR